MCRLLGMNAGARPVTATFWLLDAPDSLAVQSHRNPDGGGIGVFGPAGTPLVAKQPIAAWDDIAFATAARELIGTTFVAHVRHASTGGHTLVNTHPFEQRGRLFAHNGVVEGLDRLDARLAELGVADLVLGETDSERVFALVTAEIAAHGDDVGAGVSRGDRLDRRAAARLLRQLRPDDGDGSVGAALSGTPTSCGCCRGAPVARPVAAPSTPAPTASTSVPPHWRIGPAWSSRASPWTMTRVGARCRVAS